MGGRRQAPEFRGSASTAMSAVREIEPTTKFIAAVMTSPTCRLPVDALIRSATRTRAPLVV
jgi:hypothetical protein